ncbi:MAG: M28 family peptidase [Actinobacteria bacterium]|nr:M28 family peptidase [Actinomycetota bacterium]
MKKTTVAMAVVAFLLVGALAGFGIHTLVYRNTASTGEMSGAGSKDNATGGGQPGEPLDEEDNIADAPPRQEAFNPNYAMQHIRYLSMSIGPRPQGTAPEIAAADYARSQFSSYGYSEVREQSFPLKNGLYSQNIYVDDTGSNPTWTIIVGAHTDTIAGPGANDNASGVGTVLELARVFKIIDQVPNLRFVAFGAEEITEGFRKPNDHYGSKYMAAQLSNEDINVIGMISIDMVGVGSSLYVNATLQAPKTFLDLFYAYATQRNVALSYNQDPGWSDHESFEAHGISSFWLEYRKDPNYHTAADTYDRIRSDLINQVGNLLQGFLESIDANACTLLDEASDYR